jgi:hypothetical protein
MQLKVSNKGNDAQVTVFQGICSYRRARTWVLKREGENLHYDLYISFSEAVLGVSEILKQSMVKWESNLKKVFNQENLEIKRKRDPINGYGNGDLLVLMFGHLKHWIKIKNNFWKTWRMRILFQILKTDKSFWKSKRYVFLDWGNYQN